jgi:predicted transcriptional regulator
MKKTSKDAYNSITLDNKRSMWMRIIKALRSLKEGGNYDQIARKIKVEPVKVARRLNELVEAGIVVNTKNTTPTRTGRRAMVRKLKKI